MTSPENAPDQRASRHSADVDVLVVGGGITGIYQLYLAREAGFSVQLLEAGHGVGGTWYWNRYPGARFDSESYTYAYLFSRELFEDWEWREHFAEQPEIERYLNHVVDRFDLRPHMRFGARVTSADYDERAALWTVTDDTGAVVRAQHFVAATGVLSIPYFPDVPGREAFEGESYHTGLWPDCARRLRRQAGRRRRHRVERRADHSRHRRDGGFPDRAAALAQLVHAARTTRPSRPTSRRSSERTSSRSAPLCSTSPSGFLHVPHDRAAFDDSEEERAAFFEGMWRSRGFSKLTSNYSDVMFDGEANAAWCDFLAGKIRAIVEDPETADKLIPNDHRFGEKRPPFVTAYFEAYNKANVDLVDLRATPMVAGDDRGHRDHRRPSRVRHHRLGDRLRLRHRGLGAVWASEGAAAAPSWTTGPTVPRRSSGIQTTGFPNFFFPGGPHAAAGNNPRYNGDQVEFVTEILVHLRATGCDAIEVTEAAEEKWTAMVDRWATKAPAFGESSYYFGTNIPGKPRKYLLNSAGRPKLLADIAKVKETGYEAFTFSGCAERSAPKPDLARRRTGPLRRSPPASAESPRRRAAAAAAP